MNTPLADSDLPSIRQELNELRAEVAALRKNRKSEHTDLEILNEPSITDRRGMLKKVAGLAIGVATVGLLKPSAAKAFQKDAPASTGSALLLGKIQSANEFDKTIIRNPGLTLFATLFVADNYGETNGFIYPNDTNIALVGNTDTTPLHGPPAILLASTARPWLETADLPPAFSAAVPMSAWTAWE